ncbi:MAG: hypothetical protein J7J15_03490 [Candidatus Aenigmarchaeota archaeon]|nr:hypothetical protein [Candidatus Aenigmarchaeota archaeon]
MVKGQVALEYLMTYGIAIAIVVIAVAALYSMGVFSPSSSTVACSPCFSNFAFVDYSNGTLVLKNGARDINITNVTYTNAAGTTLQASIPSSSNCQLNKKCDANKQFEINFTASGSGTTQTIKIHYKDILSKLPHTDTATIHN